MAQRYIYLSDELNNRLKQESNASALIVRLLNNHYEHENNKEDLSRYTDDELKTMLENKKKEKELEKQLEDLKNGT